MKKVHNTQPQQCLGSYDILSLPEVLYILEKAMEKMIAKSSWLPVSELLIELTTS